MSFAPSASRHFDYRVFSQIARVTVLAAPGGSHTPTRLRGSFGVEGPYPVKRVARGGLGLVSAGYYGAIDFCGAARAEHFGALVESSAGSHDVVD